jgi:hypothetical protein
VYCIGSFPRARWPERNARDFELLHGVVRITRYSYEAPEPPSGIIGDYSAPDSDRLLRWCSAAPAVPDGSPFSGFVYCTASSSDFGRFAVTSLKVQVRQHHQVVASSGSPTSGVGFDSGV